MTATEFLINLFNRWPEGFLKNQLRYFMTFSPLVPKIVSDLSPLKGYFLYHSLRPGDVVIDAGAYPGDFAIYAAKQVGSSGKVFCFEPDREGARRLGKLVKRYGLENIDIVPRGLADNNHTVNRKTLNALTGSDNSSEEVELVSLDNFAKLANLRQIDFIKMDIEGFEVKAIRGASEILKKYHPKLAIASYHIVKGQPTYKALEKGLSGYGYKVKTDFPPHITTYAWKK